MKKKSKMKKIELPETYTCPICGKSHKNKELCPIVLSRKNKIKFDTQSYIMGSIFLECLEQRVNFFQIIKEIAYFMEELSLNSLAERISFNTDFMTSYFASAIGCSPYKFYKKLPELASKYDMYIDKASVSFAEIDGVEVDEDNSILEICLKLDVFDGTLSEMLDNAGYYHLPKLILHKVFNGRKPTYHLVMDYYWGEPGRCQKAHNDTNNKPYFQVSNICFGEHTALDGFEL